MCCVFLCVATLQCSICAHMKHTFIDSAVLHGVNLQYEYNIHHVIFWSLQLALALQYIHLCNLIHRDVKSSKYISYILHLYHIIITPLSFLIYCFLACCCLILAMCSSCVILAQLLRLSIRLQMVWGLCVTWLLK